MKEAGEEEEWGTTKESHVSTGAPVRWSWRSGGSSVWTERLQGCRASAQMITVWQHPTHFNVVPRVGGATGGPLEGEGGAWSGVIPEAHTLNNCGAELRVDVIYYEVNPLNWKPIYI